MNFQWKVWLDGARPRTFPAAVVPVVVGTSAGYLASRHFSVTQHCQGTVQICGQLTNHVFSFPKALLALIVALGIQIGTNYVNDYADGERGTDRSRVGPTRLVASELATAREVKIAAAIAFGVAGIAGLLLALMVTWWFIPLGLLCGVAGWAYTGGPKPYGYLGLGEVFVFVFFGLVATAGSAYVQHAPFGIKYKGILFTYIHYPWGFVVWCGVPIGLLAAALLQANNIRDIDTDKVAGKKTLAVRLGRQNAGLLYALTLMAVALSIGVIQHYRGYALVALLGLVFAIRPVRLALSDREGRRLLPMLGATAQLQMVVGLLLTVGLLLLRP
ncbi:MAG TPA: 1,4-dihydroxy-2-naphthoate polyprenyltransferase [Acidimicrobiales bacterium]|jgi:1,4-dihydroxy-2-naphthoate octaprenyltransferase